MVVATEVYNTSHIVMVWERNEACVGHFLEIFQPLENAASQRPLFEKQAVAHLGPSYASFHEILRRFDVDRSPEKWHALRREKYRLFKPVSFVLHEVFQFVTLHDICHCIGVHIRHTDLDTHYSVANTNHSSNIPFFHFIDSHTETNSSNPCVYLMTDNPTTQHIFLNRYGTSRLLVYDTIRSASVHHEANHRFTSLFHTLVDVLITAFTSDFKGSKGSSLSELVWLFNVTFVNQSDFFETCSGSSSSNTRREIVI